MSKMHPNVCRAIKFALRNRKTRLPSIRPFNQQNLRDAISALNLDSLIRDVRPYIKNMIYELMKCETRIRRLEMQVERLLSKK
jgi:hypothetical protein